MLWMVSAALAGTPVTCEAVYIGPVEECQLKGQWMAAGTAASEAAARKRALARLMAATGLAMEAHSLQTAGTMASVIAEQNRAICPAIIEEAVQISCFARPELSASQTCFADFPDEECPAPEVIILEGIGHKMTEKGHQQVCREVDQALKTESIEEAQARLCQSRCLTDARVRCR